MYEGIMAGVDGSFDPALWAASEAAARGLRLELVRVDPPPRSRPDDPGRDLLDEAVRRVNEAFPEVKVWPVLLHGGASTTLAGEASRIGFAVLGRPSRRDAAASTAFQVAGQVHCPVVVVPDGQGRRTGDVVVGVDGSTHAARALRFAFDEAAVRRCRLRMVHVFHGRAASMDPDRDVRMPEKVRRLSAAALMGGHLTHPGVEVVEEAYCGNPHEILLRLGERSGLVVVGSRGLGDRWGRAFGSVSRPLLHEATFPLAIVRR